MKKPKSENDFIKSQLIKTNAPFSLRTEFDEYVRFENRLRATFCIQEKDIENIIKKIYLFALNSLQELAINLKECVRLRDLAEAITTENGASKLFNPSTSCTSQTALVIWKSLGFQERSPGKGNFTYLHISLLDASGLLAKINKNEPIGALITINKAKEWIVHHSDQF